MLRLYLHLSVILILLFTLCGFALSELGSTQPINPALRGFVEGCEGMPQPCWYGLQFDPDTIDMFETIEVETRLRNVGFEVSSQLDVNSGYIIAIPHNNHLCRIDLSISITLNQVYLITLTECPSISLGDIIQLLGSPNQIDACRIGEHTLIYDDINVEVALSPNVSLSLHSPVIAISFLSSSLTSFRQEVVYTHAVPWHSVAPLWFYDYLDPNTTDCLYR